MIDRRHKKRHSKLQSRRQNIEDRKHQTADSRAEDKN